MKRKEKVNSTENNKKTKMLFLEELIQTSRDLSESDTGPLKSRDVWLNSLKSGKSIFLKLIPEKLAGN